MFKAKHSPRVITQHEHLKLSGAVAMLWGNEGFELPPCSFDSFLAGIALHDRGYGPFDERAIGESSEKEWLHVSRLSFFGLPNDDAIADLIVKHHIFRLVSTTHSPSPLQQKFLAEMRAHIDAAIQDNGLDAHLFAFIDRITDLCDRISFDFCFQNFGSHSVPVYRGFSDTEQRPVEYTIGEDNTIKIAPWPLGVESYKGYLIGYEAGTFPQKLDPQLVPFTLSAQKE